MNCPICNIPLTMAERQGVEIDFCSKCRGVWLDRGELDKIIERAAIEMTSRPAPERQEVRSEHHYDKHQDKHHDNHYDRHGHYKKKRGFLSELFD